MSWLFSKALTDEHMSRLRQRIQTETERAANLLDSMSAEEQRCWPLWSEYRSAIQELQAKIDQGWLSQDVCSKAPLCKWPKGDPCSCDGYGVSHRQAVASKRVRPSSQRNKNRQSPEQSSTNGSCSSFENACEREHCKKKEKCRREVCVSLRYLQELAEEYSADTSLAGEQFAQLSVMPTPHKFSRNDKMMEFSDLSRFGLTCAILTESRGEELLMSFLEGFHVRTLAQLEKAQESMVRNQDFGGTWQELSVKYDLILCSWRTHHCLLEEDLQWSSVTLPKWGMTRNGVVFQHSTLERLTSETEFGSLQRIWTTPSASDAGRGGCITEKMTGTSLAQQVNTPSRIPLFALQLDTATGPMNPEWVEWLMGWPIGWTELKPLEMDRFHEWRQQHSPCLNQIEDAA